MNPPYDVFLLETIDRSRTDPRPRKTPERDRLQRLGLIESVRPGLIFDERRPYWRTTDKGKLEAQKNRDEGLLDLD